LAVFGGFTFTKVTEIHDKKAKSGNPQISFEFVRIAAYFI